MPSVWQLTLPRTLTGFLPPRLPTLCAEAAVTDTALTKAYTKLTSKIAVKCRLIFEITDKCRMTYLCHNNLRHHSLPAQDLIKLPSCRGYVQRTRLILLCNALRAVLTLFTLLASFFHIPLFLSTIFYSLISKERIFLRHTSVIHVRSPKLDSGIRIA
jgi:hypothetical protein